MKKMGKSWKIMMASMVSMLSCPSHKTCRLQLILRPAIMKSRSTEIALSDLEGRAHLALLHTDEEDEDDDDFLDEYLADKAGSKLK